MIRASAIRALVVEDEAIARRRLCRLLAQEADVEVVGEAGDPDAAVAAVRARDPNLLLLDIRLSRGDGFDVLRRLDAAGIANPPVVIFVTAYDEHALRAFDAHALDYVLKPIDPERLHTALTRARQRLAEAAAGRRHQHLVDLLRAAADPADAAGREAGPPAAGAVPSSARRRFAIRREGRIFYVPVEEVDWIEGAGNYVRLHLAKGVEVMRETMSTLERELDPERFVRVHRSAIVNIARVRELQPWFSGDWVILLHNGATVKLSRLYRDAFTARMERR